jgi:hypothetical protein
MYLLFSSLIIASQNAVTVFSTIIIGQMAGKKFHKTDICHKATRIVY